MLMKLLPTILFTMSMMSMLLSMLLTTTNHTYIIEWEMMTLLSMNMKMDIMLEWSNLMYLSTE